MSQHDLALRVGYKNQSSIGNLENRAGGTGGSRISVIADASAPWLWRLRQKVALGLCGRHGLDEQKFHDSRAENGRRPAPRHFVAVDQETPARRAACRPIP